MTYFIIFATLGCLLIFFFGITFIIGGLTIFPSVWRDFKDDLTNALWLPLPCILITFGIAILVALGALIQILITSR
jgi:TRAP-type C4-dicarboxylate transport system permease small subunit